MSRYRTLIEFAAYHVFTGDKPCQSLSFELDVGSQSVVNSAGLLLKLSGGSFEILYDESRTDVLEALIADDAVTLAWRMYSTAPSLADCTWPSLMQQGQMLYLESNPEHSSNIHNGEFVDKSDFVDLSDKRLPEWLSLRDRSDVEAGDRLVV